MRKISCILLICMLVCFGGCSQKQEEPKQTLDPAEMRNICELATLKCYYHNVATYKKENVSGFWLWKKDLEFWISYAGTVTLGIDASRLEMVNNGNEVKITIPKAQVFDTTVDQNTMKFYYPDNSPKGGAEEQTEAYAKAQEDMKEQAQADSALLDQAQQRAMELIEYYVENIGEITNTEYAIEWNVIDNTPDSTEAVEDTQL